MTTTQSHDNRFNSTSISIGNTLIRVNQDGFLINFNEWTKDVALTMAKNDQLELSESHWATIDFLRAYFREFAVPPSPKLVTRAVRQHMKNPDFSNKHLKQIFPLGGCKHACRLAGLPRHFSYAC